MTAYEHTHTNTHTLPTTYFLCFKWQPRGSRSSSVVPALAPAHTLSAKTACSPLNASSSSWPSGPNAPPQPTVYNHSDTVCPFNRNGFDCASRLLWSYEVLIVHSVWPWAPSGWTGLLNNWDVERKRVRQIDDEMNPIFGRASKDTAAECPTL